VKVHYCIGKAVALALFSVSIAGCSNPFSDDPKQIDAEGQSADIRRSGDNPPGSARRPLRRLR